MDSFDDELLAGVRAARRAFTRRLEPVRNELWRYCRRLTGDVWDAEDLLQETLTRAFARAADSHERIERILPWLVRIATNAYLDSWRRPAPVPVEKISQAAVADTDPIEVREALGEVATLLPPQERAALLLKEVFDYPLAEIAAMLGTSVGAVKAALHRGRTRLADANRQTALAQRPAPDRTVLDALADAFTAYDIERLTALLLADATSEVIGMVYEVGRDTMRRGSIHHTLVLEDDVHYCAELHEYRGEPLVLLWESKVDGSASEAVADMLRIDTADGGVSRLRWYYFCPETLTEVVTDLGLPVRPRGYHL